MDSNSFSLLTNSNLIYPTSLSVTKTVSSLLPVDSRKSLSFQPNSSNGRAYVASQGGNASSRKIFYGSTYKVDESSTTTSLDSKSSSRENLISLFKRIQIEISQEESGSGIYSKSSQASIDDETPVETSVLEFLQQSDRETKVNSSKLKLSEDSHHNKKSTKKEISIRTTQPPSNKFTRPPSKFVKKSPIPSSTLSQSTDVEMKDTELPNSEADKGSSSVEKMKLTELKELAKERGIKGYSKLKKNELIQLLKNELIQLLKS